MRADEAARLIEDPVWTHPVAKGAADLTLFGIVPAVDQANVVNVVMALVSIATVLFGGTAKRAIG